MPSQIVHHCAVSCLALIEAAAQGTNARVFTLNEPCAAHIIVVGPDCPQPLTEAQTLKKRWPRAQLLFLVSPGQNDRFRALLPFVPRLASAWSLECDTPVAPLAALFAQMSAIAVAEEARSLLRRRVNEKLASATLSNDEGANQYRQQQLGLSEEYLATLLGQSPNALIVLLRDVTVASWNGAAERLFGTSADAAVGQPLDRVLARPMFEMLLPLIAQALEGHVMSGHEVAQGNRWFRVDAAPVRDVQGSVATVSLAVHEITNERLAERRLLASEHRYQQLTEMLPQLVWSCFPDGRCNYLSRQWVEYTGLSADEQLGFAWLDRVVHPDDQARVRSQWEGAVAGQYPYDVDYRIRRYDGVYRWFKTRGLRILERDGQTTQWFGTSTDIEDSVRARETLMQDAEVMERRVALEVAARGAAEQALHRAQKMEAIGKLTGGVAHDFNNLLQVIRGNLELLTSEVSSSKGVRRLTNAQEGVTRGAKLASQLLSFGRRQPLAPRPLEVGKFIQNLDDLLRRALGEAIQLETVVAGGVWNTLVDQSNLENALLNLAINARDAMEGEGKLTIEATNASLDLAYSEENDGVKPGQYVLIAVTDTGPGMSPEIMAQAFEPFFSTKTEGRGTGLGLSMVFGFAKQSNGHVKIYSELGHGTTVKVYLPRTLQSEEAATQLLATPLVGGTETILVAEDDEPVRDSVVALLTELGYQVLQAKDAQSALAIVESGIHVDMVFSDVVMPGPLRSPDMVKQVRDLLPNVAILFTSGYTQNAIVHGGKLDAGVELLSKPYTREMLAKRVRHVMDQQCAAL